LSASRTGRLYPQKMFLVLIFTRGRVDPTVGRNMSLKNQVTPPGIDPGTVGQVVQSLNHYATPGPNAVNIHVYKLLSINRNIFYES
jgi:hypothetical protein